MFFRNTTNISKNVDQSSSSTFSNGSLQGTQLAPLDAHAGHGEALLTAVDLPRAARPDTRRRDAVCQKNFDVTDIFQMASCIMVTQDSLQTLGSAKEIAPLDFVLWQGVLRVRRGVWAKGLKDQRSWSNCRMDIQSQHFLIQHASRMRHKSQSLVLSASFSITSRKRTYMYTIATLVGMEFPSLHHTKLQQPSPNQSRAAMRFARADRACWGSNPETKAQPTWYHEYVMSHELSWV